MTPLEELIAEIVAEEGPMPLDRYMALCLGHPQFGYYMSRDPFGEAGDFTTAPEISQMFGELIGVWAMAVWQEMGSPAPFALVELGPGRGTLMNDLLRAAKAMPEFAEAARINFVETSPVLRAMQETVIGAERASWHESLDTLPDLPTILIANEFFDAIPVKQYGNGLVIGHAPATVPSDFEPWAYEGAIVENAPARAIIAERIGEILKDRKAAAIIIDYGYDSNAAGDTLQAVQAHKFVPLLHEPGDCDLTAHVDFEALCAGLARGGATVSPLITQREFLHLLGLEARAERLSAKATEAQQADIASAVKRLAGPSDMGNLFKVVAAVTSGSPMPFPFSAS
jgi:NADH dehydrogenase [ubiquinone] 1 alpha subcomplex assembly factor 7